MNRGPRVYHIRGPFDRSKGPAALIGVSWQHDDDNKDWVRHVLRKHGNGDPYWSRTVRVLAELPFCMECLSPNVTFEGNSPTSGEIWCCHDCDRGFFRIIPDDQ